MHFLICIGGEQYSRDTLKFGISLASGLRADVSILYVHPKISYLFKTEVRVSQEKLERWQIDTTEARIMKGVEEILLEEGFLRTVDGKIDVRHLPKPGIHGAYEYHLYGKEGENVRIRMREGDIVDNIIRETMEIPYDLVMVGASRDGGRLVHQIIHYIETSVLIVKAPVLTNRFLLCIDDSRAARKAEEFCVRAATLLKTSIDILSVYTYPWEEQSAQAVAERAQRVLRHFNVAHTVRIRRGPVVRTILQEAEPDHIVVMGSSRRSNLFQFFAGSRPSRIGRQGRNSVLVVK